MAALRDRRRRASFVAGFVVVAAVIGGVWAWCRAADPVARGRAAYDRREWTVAAALARSRLAQDRDDPEALQLLARTSVRLGRDDAAQAMFLRLGAERAEAEDFYLLGTTLTRQGRDDQATVILERAAKADPDHAETLDALTTLYARHDFPLAARDTARRLSRIRGWQAQGEWALGRLDLELYDPAGASAALERALTLDPTARSLGASAGAVRKLLTRALLASGRADAARAVLQTELDPDREAWWLLSRSYLQQGEMAKARSALASAGDFGADDPTAPEPAPYVGAARCASCHAAIHRTEQSSRHAASFARGGNLPGLPLPKGTIADPGDARVTHTLTRTDEAMKVQTRDADRLSTALVEYAFGSDRRAVTLVVRDDAGEAREYRLTHYGESPCWDLTIRHAAQPGSRDEFLGKPLTADTVRGCLQCHTTHYSSTPDRTAPELADRGIGCERCHGPGGNHLKAVEAKFPDPAIARPRIAGAQRVTALCAQCHSPRVAPVSQDDPTAIRFQGTTLTWSRCYNESRGEFGCVTCHSPHRDAETSPAFYEAKCLGCHRPATASPAEPPRGHPCPVRPSEGCLQCHMPKVPEVFPHVSYTDHYIRVRKP